MIFLSKFKSDTCQNFKVDISKFQIDTCQNSKLIYVKIDCRKSNFINKKKTLKTFKKSKLKANSSWISSDSEEKFISFWSILPDAIKLRLNPSAPTTQLHSIFGCRQWHFFPSYFLFTFYFSRLHVTTRRSKLLPFPFIDWISYFRSGCTRVNFIISWIGISVRMALRYVAGLTCFPSIYW